MELVRSDEFTCRDEECVANFLIVEKSFKKGLLNGTEKVCENCDGIVETLKSTFLATLKTQIEANDTKCINEFLATYRISDLYLKGFAYYNLQLSEVKNFDEEKGKSSKEVSSTIDIVCGDRVATEEEFRHASVMLVSGALLKMFDYEESEDNCLMKHLFDSKVISLKQFNISSDQLNVTECQEVVENFETRNKNTEIAWVEQSPTFYGLISDSFKICWKEKLAQQKFFFKIAAFYFASVSELDQNQNTNTRIEFKQTMAEFSKSFFHCFAKILKM